jgi:hypothetical protein
MKLSMAADQRIVSSLQESFSVNQAILQNRELLETIAFVAAALTEALRRGRKIFFFGNGASAADGHRKRLLLRGSVRPPTGSAELARRRCRSHFDERHIAKCD